MGGKRRVFTEESGLHLDLEGWGNLEVRRVRQCIRRAKKDANSRVLKADPGKEKKTLWSQQSLSACEHREKMF